MSFGGFTIDGNAILWILFNEKIEFEKERSMWMHTVDLNKRATGFPSIVSEYNDAAELICSTTEIKAKIAFCLSSCESLTG